VANDYLKVRDPFGYDLVSEFMGKMKNVIGGSRIKGMVSGEIKSPDEWLEAFGQVHTKYFGESSDSKLETSPLDQVKAFLADEFWLDFPLNIGYGFGCFGPPTFWDKYLKSDFSELTYEEFVDLHIDHPKKRQLY
jgi:hypothetical protein